jgi:hypothetical protein
VKARTRHRKEFADDVLTIAMAAGNGGACPFCMARCLVDTAASIAELTLGHDPDPADWLEREAQRVRDELYEAEPTLQ